MVEFSGRALTVKNPWGFAIHRLDKGAPGIGCENRTKPPPAGFVGADAPWIAMHTGCHVATRGEVSILVTAASKAGWDPRYLYDGYSFQKNLRGTIADMECFSNESLIPGLFRILSYDAPYLGDLTGWRNPAEFGYRIEYRALPTPIRCLGPTPGPGKSRSCNLGWWVVPDDVAAVIRGVL